MPDGKGFLLVEFGGETRTESDAKALKLMAKLRSRPRAPTMKLFDNPEHEQQVWKVRESGLGATAHIPGEEENWEGWEDSAVPPEKVGDYLRDLKKLYNKYGYVGALYGHFGQGCIHTRINFDVKTAQGIGKFRRFLEEATDLIVSYGGSFSGEHGDGQSKAEFQPKLFGPELVQAFAEFKNIFDPDWKMNPGKLVRPYRMDENLRYGTSYAPPAWNTHFHFSADGFSFARATERCVGVGQCRRRDGGTMCPSYMATREEKHSTRGRAHLLFEMLQGNPLRRTWRNAAVKEALDLCLSCKGCKGDCPVNVDMATYKAEFLSHYYQGRLRPRHAYVFGLIHCWARLASWAPALVNSLCHSRFFAGIVKWLGGVAQQRSLPEFATETLQDWFRKRPLINLTKPRIVLWPDTFNNFFHPQVARAAVEVLEDAGFRVLVPQENFCCGRPLYDYGMLDTAQRWLKKILCSMRDEIQAGTPFVVLEPSCATVFRDELKDLLAHDQDAQRLARQTFLLSEFLQRHVPNYVIRQLDRKALVHLHCHHRAIMGPTDEKEVLQRLGLDFEILDSGCCGMAGAFGFEKGEHYAVSIKCGERVLLPKTRAASSTDLLITDGFSCHEQIRQQTGREALHLAEVLHLAMREGRVPQPKRSSSSPAEISGGNGHTTLHDHRARRGAVAGALAGAAAGALWLVARRKE
jgi:Fe-S oxidoreductase